MAFGIFWLKCAENSIPVHGFENAVWIETSSQRKGHIRWQVGKLGSLHTLGASGVPSSPPASHLEPCLHLCTLPPLSHSSSIPYSCLSQFSAFWLGGEANSALWNGSWPCALGHRVSSLPSKVLGHLWTNVVRIPASDWLCL